MNQIAATAENDAKVANSEKVCKTLDEIFAKLPTKTQKQINKQLDYLYHRPLAYDLRKALRKRGQEELAANKWFVCTAFALMKVVDVNYRQRSGDIYFSEIPTKIICSQLTGTHADEYDKKSDLRSLMGAISREILPALEREGLIEVRDYISKVVCRGFDVSGAHTLIDKVVYAIAVEQTDHDMGPDAHILLAPEECPPTGVGRKPAPNSDTWAREKSRLAKETLGTIEYLRNCTFTFEADLYKRMGHRWIEEFVTLTSHRDQTERNRAKKVSIRSALGGLDVTMYSPQYHATWHLQGPGRIHTIGGPLNLSKELRWLLIGPSNDNNVMLELDLKCAQLIILCKLLGCDELLEKIKSIIHNGGSIWKHICPKDYDVPKRALKVIVYSLCFGARLKNLRLLANGELEKHDTTFRFTQEQIDAIQDGFLKPLVEAREKWLRQYKVKNLIDDKNKCNTPVIIKNKLGRPFHLKKEAKEYYAKYMEDKARYEDYRKAQKGKVSKKRPSLNNMKIAGKALAHMAQGWEQWIMQSFISGPAMRENIVSFQYDGLTVEVHPDSMDEVMQRYQGWLKEFDPDQMFEFIPIRFRQNKLLTYHLERVIPLTLSNNWEIFNHNDSHVLYAH
ncbi:hypothetical protein [Pseudanabaena sp. FACHB-2040]|uniref:hypothetical protein n=1 Tax=Pseudanabaena sp. FACHB-2040 TaxID=2692859 RepID=UPI001683FD81|nr:hypothetical protein [Pseudanabaena sp. FACHB-2040]MBD2256673.1 hypothetical protein [Pseudanabaena sp. FACHB-2040]